MKFRVVFLVVVLVSANVHTCNGDVLNDFFRFLNLPKFDLSAFTLENLLGWNSGEVMKGVNKLQNAISTILQTPLFGSTSSDTQEDPGGELETGTEPPEAVIAQVREGRRTSRNADVLVLENEIMNLDAEIMDRINGRHKNMSSSYESNPLTGMTDLGILRHLFKYSTNSLKSTAMCHACKVGIGIIMFHTRLGGRKSVLKLGEYVCKFFKFVSDDLCDGAIERFGPVLLYIISKRPELNPDAFCAMMLQASYCDMTDAAFEWDIPLYEGFLKANPEARITDIVDPNFTLPPGSRTLKVLHLTDMHVDPYYVPGTSAVCRHELCCRFPDNESESDPSRQAGYHGDYRYCDLPYHTFVNALEHITKQHPDIDLVYMTGDIIPHHIGSTLKEETVHLLANTSTLLRTYFPKVTVIPVIGNHDVHPGNMFTPSGVPKKLSTDWVYKETAKGWSNWIPSGGMSTFLHAGYYDRVISPKFRVLVINSNVCNLFNFWQMYEPKDPGGQLRWLAGELAKSEEIGQKVHILGHIPPGEDCWNVWGKNFYKIIARYQSTVTGLFYGHTHYDDFKVFYDPVDRKRAINSVWVGAGLTTFTGMNPGYKIFTVDGARGEDSTYQVMDHETWIFDLEEANESPGVPPTWFRLYKATEDYGIPNVLPQSLNTLVERMARNVTLFNLYYKHTLKGVDLTESNECDTFCRKQLLCNIVTPFQSQHADCMAMQTKFDRFILPNSVKMSPEKEKGRPAKDNGSEEEYFLESDETTTESPSNKKKNFFEKVWDSVTDLFG